MSDFKPVSISRAGFAFCRYTVAALAWLALVLQEKWILALIAVIMALSWLLKVEKAPLIALYHITLDRIFAPEMVMVDENGMRFAHAVGAVMSAAAFFLWAFAPPPVAWGFTLLLALMKTMSALGRCSALKLYSCMKGGNCCRFGRYVRGKRRV